MKVVLTGGGTGGHIYPALSVASVLADAEVEFIGSADGPEARVVPAAGLRFHAVPSRKLARTPGAGTLLVAGTAAASTARAAALLRRIRPDVVLGTGGYASGPVALAAALLRIPLVILEGNAIPGRANRWLARFATRVAITYEESRSYFPARKTVLTGFPVREEIRAGNGERARRESGLDPQGELLFAFGGSAGAESINRALAEALPRLLAMDLQILHQTGRGKEGSVPPPARHYCPRPYIENMADALAAAALVVCRGGASTLAELTAVGRPAIVVPYPHAHADHQTHNAHALAEAGAALVIPDAQLNGARLVEAVSSILGDPDRRERMRQASAGCGRPDAARRVAEDLRAVAAGVRGRWSGFGVRARKCKMQS